MSKGDRRRSQVIGEVQETEKGAQAEELQETKEGAQVD
jgi:hypothetical protein